MMRIAVTEAEYRKARAVFDGADGMACIPVPPNEDDLCASIRELQAQHAIVGAVRYEDLLYRTLPRGGVLARFGVGHDGIDKARATASGILCVNTPGVLDESVAEYVMALLLEAARHLVRHAEVCRRGSWEVQVGREVSGKRLAVIGCGPIGRLVGRAAAHGFRMEVVGCDAARVDAAELASLGFSRITGDFADAVAGADFVSLHIPGSLPNRHFLNRERLAMIPSGAILINTARGSVVDEIALFDALAAGSLAGTALDVFEEEPYCPQDPAKDLRTLPNVIQTPHVASSTREACDRVAERALGNIALAEAGRFVEMDLLNPEVLAQGDHQ
jgi:phosphoglycerate dehydrogenase-like enzyme